MPEELSHPPSTVKKYSFETEVVPLFLGGFSLYMSLRNGEMLYVYQRQKRYRFPLRRLVKEGRREDLVRYLKTHPPVRNKVKIDR